MLPTPTLRFCRNRSRWASAGPPRSGGYAQGWRTTDVVSAAATPAGTTAGRCPWCCSCSRPPVTRTPSWTPSATSTTLPSPAPTWRPSPNTASWLTRGRRPTVPTGCRCTGWERDTKMYLPVPGVSCRGATVKGDFQGTNPVRPPRPGTGAFWCRTGAQTGLVRKPMPTRSVTSAKILTYMTRQE